MLDRESLMIADQENETVEQAQIRNQLYYAFKDSRSEPGLSLKKVSSILITAFDREEVLTIIKYLNAATDF